MECPPQIVVVRRPLEEEDYEAELRRLRKYEERKRKERESRTPKTYRQNSYDFNHSHSKPNVWPQPSPSSAASFNSSPSSPNSMLSESIFSFSEVPSPISPASSLSPSNRSDAFDARPPLTTRASSSPCCSRGSEPQMQSWSPWNQNKFSLDLHSSIFSQSK